jgi:Conserved TM helix
MRELIVSELMQAVQELARGFARFLPRLVVLVIIAFAGWVIAYLLKMVARSILRLIKFDKLSENAGASQLLAKAALPPSSELLSRFVFWVAWLGFILLGVSVLGIFGLQDQIARFFLFLPRLFTALFIVFFGLLAASFFSRAVLLGAVNSNQPSPRLLSTAVRAVIIVFVLSMAFEELGIADQTVLVAFGIAFGAVMLGFAIAFGLGGKELAQRFLESRLLHRNGGGKNEDELSPL